MNDLISRKSTLEALIEKGQNSKRYEWGECWELNGEEIREVLDSLPSVKSPSGRLECYAGELPKCTACGYEFTDRLEFTNYCSHCGAKINKEWVNER